jgi:hypothetical protein
MKSTIRLLESHTARRAIAIAIALLSMWGDRGAHAKQPVEPVRRDARTVVTKNVTVAFDPSGPSLVEQFGSAKLVLPRSTTRELARFARATDAPTAARWLCDAYASPPSSDPDASSLRSLVAEAAAVDAVGASATGAYVCPTLPRHVRITRTRVTNFPCLFGCDTDSYTVVSHILAVPSCQATDEQRQAIDAATCSTVLLGSSGRATALRIFLRRTRRRHACLQLSIDAAPKFSFQIRSTSENCDD